MPKFNDYTSNSEVRDIMERYLDKFTVIFDGFDIDGMEFIMTQKKQVKTPIRLKKVGYPFEVFVGKPYIVEVFEEAWKKLSLKQRHQAVFHTMCSIPVGGSDPASNSYGGIAKPEIQMYTEEFAAVGGITNWMENDAAIDPMDVEQEDVVNKIASLQDEGEAIPTESVAPSGKFPVTADAIAKVAEEAEVESAA